MLDLQANTVTSSSEIAQVTLAFLEFAVSRIHIQSRVTRVQLVIRATERTAKVLNMFHSLGFMVTTMATIASILEINTAFVTIVWKPL